MARRPKLTDAERDQRRAADRERLKQAAEQLLSTDGWQRWVRLRSRAGLARLSLSNQLLIALAKPDATFVAGYKAWLGLGYCVRKGEKAIRIIAPMPIKQRDRATGEQTGQTSSSCASLSARAASAFKASASAPRIAIFGWCSHAVSNRLSAANTISAPATATLPRPGISRMSRPARIGDASADPVSERRDGAEVLDRRVGISAHPPSACSLLVVESDDRPARC